MPGTNGLGALGVGLIRDRAGVRRARILPLLLLVGGCADAPRAPLAGWNLVVVNVDALRADHLGFHGYARPTSPCLDALAAGGVVFEQAISSSSFTRESVATLLTGRLPSSGPSAGWSAAPAAGSGHLGESLRAAGYRTGFFSNTLMLRDPGFTRGFEEVQHLPARFGLSGEGPRLTARALRFVRKNRDGPFALYLHYLDPHAPYEPDPELLARLADPPPTAADDLVLYRDVVPRLGALRARGFGPGDPRFESLVLRYDAEILGTDAAIGALVRGLERLGVADRTLLVVTADHGEEFLEHGGVEHGWTLYQESIHVPLLFHAPGALPPARVALRVSQVDLLPTLLALLGLPARGLPLDGAPLFAIGTGGLRASPVERPVVAELLIPFRNVVRATLLGDWKLVRAWRWLPPQERIAEGRASDPPRRAAALDLAGGPAHEALYDLGSGDGERRDLLAAAPARAAALRARLDSLPTEVAISSPRAAPLAAAERERLRALGYEGE